MKIKYDNGASKDLFDDEISLAINWLIKVRDNDSKGWAWVQFIAPNEQNTAEVISALIDNSHLLNDSIFDLMLESTDDWLIDPQRHAQISIDWIWVLIALQKIKKCPQLTKKIVKADLQKSIEQCVEWLAANQNTNGGWADIKGDLSSTTRTSLSLMALNIEYRNNKTNAKLLKSIQKATKWLISNQNNDGGWGNLCDKDIDRKYQELINLSYADLRYQCDSNAACTGYALLALNEDNFSKHNSIINSAVKYIHNCQNQFGGWDVFSEVGIRAGVKYTFRHFSTAWSLKALLLTKSSDYTDESVINGINYLIQLQDANYGGWKSSADADNYTWATCNALETIHLIKTQLADVKAKQFLKIVCDWWDLRKKDCNFSFKIGNSVFAFNSATCLLFCIIYTIMIFLLINTAQNFLTALLVTASVNTNKFANGISLVAGAFILGLPWIVFVKYVFNKDMDSWINSIGWVYGIITGFLLAYYQFIL